MAASYAGFYRRVKSATTPVCDRLKLVRYAWCCHQVYLPNKRQVLIDTVCGLLVPRHRTLLSEEELTLVWACLAKLLTSLVVNGNTESRLHVKTSLGQILVDGLQSSLTKGDNCEYLGHVMKCCEVVITSPGLSYVLTTKFDSLVALLSVLCQLCTEVNLGSRRPALLVLVDHVTTVCVRCSSLQPNQKQVSQVVTERLLVPVMMVLHVAMEMPTDKTLVALSLHLQNLLEQTLFHKDHTSAFDIYLTVVCGAEGSRFKPPKMIDSLFQVLSQLVAGKPLPSAPDMSPERCQLVVCSYLPSFFRSFVQVNKKNCSLCFKLFMLICKYLGLEPGEDQSKIDLPAGCVARVANSCLQEVAAADLYSVVQDNAGGRSQFTFLRLVVKHLLQLPRDRFWYECLCRVLELNHGILETQMSSVLTRAWIQPEHVEVTDRVDTESSCAEAAAGFLCRLVSTYSRLHQIPRWFDHVLSAISNNMSSTAMLWMPGALCDRLDEILTALPQTSLLEVWHKLMDEMKGYVVLARDDEEFSKRWNMTQLCQIYHQFLSSVKVVDHSITDKTAAMVFDLMVATETDILVPLFRLCIDRVEDHAVLTAALLLCTALGGLKPLLACHCPTHRASIGDVATVSHPADLTTVSHPADLTLGHSYLSSTEWAQLFTRVDRSNNKMMSYLLDQLLIQKVGTVLMFCNNPDVSTTTVDNVLELLFSWLPDVSQSQHTASWDLRIESVSADNHCIARWKLLTDSVGVFVSALSPERTAHIAQFVVSTFQHHHNGSGAQTQSTTLTSVTRNFLKDPVVMETRPLVSSIITSLWAAVRKSLSAGKSPRKKRKCMGTLAAIMDGLGQLADPEVMWHEPSDSDLVEQLQNVAMVINKLLQREECEDMSGVNVNADIIEILHELPLYYLSPGNQLQCVFGLVFVTMLLFNQSATGEDDQSQQAIRLTLIDLLSVLLESAIGSTPVFQLMDPGIFFCWVQRLLCVSHTERLSLRVRSLMNTVSRTVTADIKVLLALEQPVAMLVSELEMSTRHLDRPTVHPASVTDRSRFTAAASLLNSITKLLKKANQPVSVKSPCEKYFTQLSSVFVSVVTKMRVREGQVTLLTPSHPIVQGFSSVLSRCAEGKTLSDDVIQDVHFVLDFAVEVVGSAKFEDYEMDLVCLKFIKTVCGCRGNIPNICGAKMFQKMWNALINMLTALSGHHSQEVMTSSNSVHLTTREVMTSLASLEESSVCDLNPVGQSGVTDLKTDQWRTRQAALLDTVTIAMSCDLDEFKSVLTGLVNDMTPTNVFGKPRAVVVAVQLWGHLLSSDLSEGQGQEVARVAQHVIFNCEEILRVVDGCRAGGVILNMAVQIVRSQTQMVNYGMILMSSHLAMVCLHSCQLLPLEGGGYETFVPAFRAVYSLLNSLMLNHTELVLQSVPSFVSPLNRLLKSLIAWGAQDKLKTNLGWVDQVVQCANMLTKLLELAASHSVELGKVSVYLLADYTSEVQKTTLLPAVKRALLPGIYAIIDICDDHGVAHLHTALPLGVREIFHLLYTDYKKHFKFTGRI